MTRCVDLATYRRTRKIVVGERFGRLVVRELLPSLGHGRRCRCVCDCGTDKIVGAHALKRGDTRSCGCFFREVAKRSKNVRHGQTGTPAHMAWISMLNRCAARTGRNHKHYAARGITVCERWRIYENFIADMGEPPPGLSLDRIDNNGNYEPGNCRWATKKQQANNRRNNRHVTLNGQTRTLQEWIDHFGLVPRLVWVRIRRGWSHERALTEEVHHG